MICFYSEELLAPCSIPKLEDHPLLAVCNCLFNMFAATLHIGDHSSIHNLRMWHIMVSDPLITALYCLDFTYSDYQFSCLLKSTSRGHWFTTNQAVKGVVHAWLVTQFMYIYKGPSEACPRLDF